VLGPLYWAISWILLRWHDLWSAAGLGAEALRTNWDWVLAIVFLVITIRVVLFPIYVKQIKSQRAMQQLAPRMKELQEKYKGDKESLQRETMKLYREEGANPLMGCLPILIQAPVMWSLFHVLRYLSRTNRSDATKTLYGWAIDKYDAAANAKLFGAPIAASFKSSASQLSDLHANGTTVKIVAGVLVVTMIVTTYLTSRQMIRKTGPADDPTQRMMQKLMLYGIPATLLFSGFTFPIGVVLYWTVTNLFSLVQQFWVLHKYPPPPISKGQATAKTTARTPSTGRTAASRTTGRTGVRTRAAGGAKTAAQTTEPSVAGKALAPKPGAKPVNPKRTAVKKATPAAKQGGDKSAGAANGAAKQSAAAKKQGAADAAKRTSG
jgi:YidC/Oxa1 family membrane protein insertase